MNKIIRPIALYLPQFHPIPENDEWWGKGFTEWTNVVRGRPRFRGHYQPHLPADLGFYDLRLEESRLAQEALAKAHGIYGFCYYHYWFNGKRLLNEPIDRKMNNPRENLPFMLCWANENWTRAWDGGEKEILLHQEYSTDDDIRHIRTLIPYFQDPRYIKVDGKPVFIIYKDSLFPDIRNTLQIFRKEAARHGLELYLCRFDRDIGTLSEPPDELGFDAAFEFQPLSEARRIYLQTRSGGINKYLRLDNYVNYVYRKVFNFHQFRDTLISYKDIVDIDIRQPRPLYKCYPGVSPGWDNSARRPKGLASIFYGSTPELFQYWLTEKLKQFQAYSSEENFIMINAWNEWAEGNHLEPCRKWGCAYLEALSYTLNSMA